MSIAKEICALRKALREDPDYYYSWQANIAMAFKDESDKYIGDARSYNELLHEIANNAAKNFLDRLIGHK